MRSRGTLWAYTSARTKRNLAFLWTALFLCSLVLQYVSLATPVAVLAASGLKAGTVQAFEIDGDLKSGDGASNPGWCPRPWSIPLRTAMTGSRMPPAPGSSIPPSRRAPTSSRILRRQQR